MARLFNIYRQWEKDEKFESFLYLALTKMKIYTQDTYIRTRTDETLLLELNKHWIDTTTNCV